MLSCSLPIAAAQVTVQQAMLRASAAGLLPGSDAGVAPTTNVAAALQQLAGQAAVIFTGSVATVKADASGAAQVEFTVERGVRGVSSGSRYSVNVSAWAGGAERYYAGERALFLLTAPSVSGYSAPVMGERGVVPLSGDTLVGNLDLRWIASDVQRGMQVAAQSVITSPQRPAAASAAAEVPGAATPETLQQDTTPATAPNALPDVRAIDRDLVLDLLRSSGAGAAHDAEQAR